MVALLAVQMVEQMVEQMAALSAAPLEWLDAL